MSLGREVDINSEYDLSNNEKRIKQEVLDQVPDENLRAIIEGCMQVYVDDRYQNMDDVIREIDIALDDGLVLRRISVS